MNGLLRYDGPIMKFFYLVMELIVLNILWIVFSIPIITAGAATTALCRVLLDMNRKIENGIEIGDFFKYFKSNFRQATSIWICYIVIGIALVFDWYLFARIDACLLRTIGVVITAFVSIVYLFTLIFIFPLQAQFDNTIVGTLVNAFRMSFANPIGTAVLVMFNTIPLLAVYFFKIGVILLFINVALVAIVDMFFFKKIFDMYIPKEEY